MGFLDFRSSLPQPSDSGSDQIRSQNEVTLTGDTTNDHLYC